MRCISWNINGIRAAEKKGFLAWLHQTQPDFLGVQEIKAKPAQLSEALLKPEGYYTAWNPAERAGYSGVATFTKKPPLQIDRGFGIPEFDEEGRSITLWFDDLILINSYFPSGTSGEDRIAYKLAYTEAFLEYAERLRRNHHQTLLFCGDVNIAHHPIDLARPKDNTKTSGFLPEERALLDKAVSMGYVDTLRHLHPDQVAYSWWSVRFGARAKNIGWRIDYFWIVQEYAHRLEEAFVLPDVMGSDHCPVGVTLK